MKRSQASALCLASAVAATATASTRALSFSPFWSMAHASLNAASSGELISPPLGGTRKLLAALAQLLAHSSAERACAYVALHKITVTARKCVRTAAGRVGICILFM